MSLGRHRGPSTILGMRRDQAARENVGVYHGTFFKNAGTTPEQSHLEAARLRPQCRTSVSWLDLQSPVARRALLSRTTTGPQSTLRCFFCYSRPTKLTGAEAECEGRRSYGQSANANGSTAYQIVKAGSVLSSIALKVPMTIVEFCCRERRLVCKRRLGIFGLPRQKLTRIPAIPTSESCPTAAPTIAPMSSYIINVQRSPIDSQGSVTAQSPATRPGFVVS
jgi:hypothetical protein